MSYLRIAEVKIKKTGYRNSQIYADAGDLVKILREDGDILIVEHCHTGERFCVNRSEVKDHNLKGIHNVHCFRV